MKSSLLASIFISLVVTVAGAKPPPPAPSLTDLVGVWVQAKCVEALHEKSVALPCSQLVVKASEDGKRFRVYYHTPTEGIGYQLLGLERTDKAGEYAFHIGAELPWGDEGNPKPGQSFRLRVLLTFDDTGHVILLKLLGHGFGMGGILEEPFTRIPVRFPQYVNRVIFAGRWKDQKGNIFSFDDSGEGHLPDGVSFTFRVDVRSGRVVRIRSMRATRPEELYLFQRSGDELRFFRRRSFLDGRGYEDTPFLVLKKE